LQNKFKEEDGVAEDHTSDSQQQGPAQGEASGHTKRKRKHPNWGGRRLGAGARPGNTNALKHGRRSERMARLGMIFATNPKTRDVLLAIADRWDRKQAKADEVANYILAQVLERGLRRGDERFEAYIEETLGRSIAKRPSRARRAGNGNLD
jgi:hypothetical protein